uniref:Mediator of RNA polymerase II transcription subunit 13 n=1 Tax=Kwoniella bestiolae CBS 10118 TaxID=1296100 RepID=A0A1B9FVN7_9TREE|nr:hypothetical protein I302_07184 [Kwoniella bestiolae CBS 10118]OCF22839.1 hypothetical protein I302_07184 [Kwoniella bestiolae CBS 10118]
MTDFLGGGPPRPTTVIPGRWIIELPSSNTQIYIHRFRQAGQSDQAGPYDYDIHDVALDPFERAWKKVNDNVNELAPISHSLEQPCAIISNERVNEKREKALWYFTTSNSEIDRPEGLEEITPPLQPISITQLVTCPKHGHESSCLDSSSSAEGRAPCNVSLDTSQDVARHLDLLASALAEKMAWKKGNRILMDEIHADTINHSLNLLKAAIRPISSTKLLLSLQPISPPSSSTSPTSPTPLRLLPLGLPALHISSSNPTSTQERHLSSTFDSALGHTWKTGRSEARTRSQISGETQSDWSVYWVPVTTPPSTKASQGIFTIWPTHLSQPYFNTGQLQTKKPVIRPIEVKSSDLLGVSIGLFNFLSTYKEPDPPQEIEEDEDEGDENMDAESTVITAEPEPVIDDGGGSDKSDLDDLFSEHSGSSTPMIPPDQILGGQLEIPLPIETPISVSTDQVDDPMGFMSTGVENRQLSRNATSTTNGLENPPKEEMVTEDDFAFFDSPSDQIAGDADIIEEHGADQDMIGGDQIGSDLLPNSTDIDAVAPGDHILSLDGNPPHNQSLEEEALDHLPQAQDAPPPFASIDTTLDHHDEEITHPQVLPPIPAIIIPDPILQPPSPIPMPSEWFTTDIIPPSFSPLPLLPLSDSPFPYSLPTPAPTPSSLNWDLVERLQPPKSSNLTYADDWKMDEEISEIDEEEMYTGPPTPESSYFSSDEEENTVVNDKKRLSESNGTEIQFSGIRCIASEWVYLLYDTVLDDDRAKALMRDWNPSWIKDLTILPPTSPAEVDNSEWYKGLDLTRFVKEMIGNKALREMFDWSDGQHRNQSATVTLRSGIEGLTLHMTDSKYRTLPQPQISAGYHNYTINLASPSLQYWTELGLQPHGGYKNVEAIILCEETFEARDKGKQLGLEMKRVWEELHLGTHNTAEVGGAIQGVITVPAAVFSESIANLMNQFQSNVIIYVLLPSITAISSSLLKSLFNISLSPLSSTVIQLVPQYALDPSHYREMAFEVYNRIAEPIKEINARSISDPYGLSQPSTSDDHITRQAFTLARAETPTPEFSMSWPLKSYDVLNNDRSIYCGYTYDEDLEVTLGFIMDDLGELFDWMVWKDPRGMRWDNRVERVWKWMKGRSEGWLINWKINVVRVGNIYGDELRAWRKISDSSRDSITLLTTDQAHAPHGNWEDDIPKPRGFANIPPSTMNDPNSQIIDLSLSAQITTIPSVRIPIDLCPPSSPNGPKEVDVVYPLTSFILTHPASANEKYHSRVYNVLSHHKKEDKRMEDDLGEGIYRIGCLISTRWGIEDGLAGILGMGMKGLGSLARG